MGVRVNLPLSFEGRMSFFKSKHYSIKDTKKCLNPIFLCVSYGNILYIEYHGPNHSMKMGVATGFYFKCFLTKSLFSTYCLSHV